MKCRIRIATIFAVFVSCFCSPASASLFESTNVLANTWGVRRIVFLGDSITYSGQFAESVESYFVTRYPRRQVDFLNLGLPSETVSGLTEDGHADGKFPRPDLIERLDRVLAKTKPDLVIACYGMNDGIYLPFSEERFGKFKAGILMMRDRIQSAGARVIHVTPPVFDEVKGGHAGYGAALDRYADWLLEMGKATGWDLVDVHGPMKRYLAERREREPDFYLASDGVHIGETGHWLMAQKVLAELGAKEVANFTNVQAMVAVHLHGKEILKLVQAKQRLLKDAWLTDTGHKRPGMKPGLPLPEAQAKAAELDRQIRELTAAPVSR